MKSLALALALLLCVLVSPSNADCSGGEISHDSDTQCLDDVDNTWHPKGSSWRNSACQDCTCEGCCDAYTTPTGYPDYCEAVFHPETCSFDVHRKDDENEKCPFDSAVGK